MVRKKREKNLKKRNNFISGARELLNSIGKNKKELKILKNEGLKNLNLKEREEIKLIKEKTKKQREEILKRYEKGKENLGKALLRRKNQELGTRLSIEKKSLNKTNKQIGKIGRNLKKIKK
jgi:hypothetical protein